MKESRFRLKQAVGVTVLCFGLSILWHAYSSPMDSFVPDRSVTPRQLRVKAGMLLEQHTVDSSPDDSLQLEEKKGLALQDYVIDAVRGDIAESSYQCIEDGKDLANKVCFFDNVFLWKGKVIFVSNNASMELERVAIDFRILSGLAFHKPRVMSQQQVAEALRSAGTVVDWSSPTDEVHVWSGAVNNYGHFMGEDMPSLHNTLCKYLGRCGEGNTTNLHLVLLRDNMFSWPPYVDLAMTCLSESRLVNVLAPEMQSTIFMIRRLLLGVGPDCRAAVFCRGYNKVPISTEQYTLYRNNMATCLGFDASAAAPLYPRPKVLVIDRLYTSGRHFLNVQEMIDGLREQYGSFADVELRYLEQATLKEQIELWNNATVVVHMHGASLGNWAFLPHKAVGVHITLTTIGNPFPKQFDISITHNVFWKVSLPPEVESNNEKDLEGVTNVSAVLVEVPFHPNAVLRIRDFEETEEWREELTMQDKLKILEEGSCKNISKPDIPGQLTCEIKYLLKGFDLSVPLEQLFEAVDKALMLAYSKQAHKPPSLLSARFGSSSDGELLQMES